MSDWQLATIVLTFLSWFAAPPTSLGDVARREALRRQLTPKSTRTLTNLDVAGVPPRPLPTMPASLAEPAKESTKEAAKEGKESTAAEPKGKAETHDEAWWHDRMTTARATLERDQLLADAMQTRINSLTADWSARDDPAQRAVLFDARTRAVTELDNLRKQIAVDRETIAGIQEEARKQGVPDGWIR